MDWDFTLNELVPGEPLTAPVQALRCDGHQHAGQYLAVPASNNSNSKNINDNITVLMTIMIIKVILIILFLSIIITITTCSSS